MSTTSMNTALPLPGAMPGTAASAPAMALNAAAPADFMVLLADLLNGGTVSLPATTLPVGAGLGAGLTESGGSGTDEDTGPEDLAPDAASLLPFTWLPMIDLQPATNAATDPVKLLGRDIGVGAGGRGDLGDLQQLQALLTEVSEAAAVDEPGAPGVSTQALSVTNEQQGARSATVADPMSRSMQSHVGTQAWADELSTRMTWMTERGQQTASLRLSPEHLGPLEIRISIRDDQASVWFGAAHADTRAAIEHALPRLRELFAAQGMSLADAGVHHSPNGEQPKFQGNAGRHGEAGVQEDEVVISSRRGLGLLDAYA